MNNDLFKNVYTPLSELLKSFPMVWKNQRRFRSLITDYYPDMKMERNLILACAEEQIPHELFDKSKCSSSDFSRFVKRIEVSYGHTFVNSVYAVSIWVKAMGILTDYDYYNVISDIISNIASPTIYNTSEFERQVYNNGYIEYKNVNIGLSITNIVYNNPELVPSESVIVIPERIGDLNIVALSVDSLNELRMRGYSKLIVPSTLKSIGSKGEKLYKSFEDKQPKRLDIYFTFTEYNNLIDINSNFNNNSLFGYEYKNTDFTSARFLSLKPFVVNSNYWVYPEDDIWKSKNVFYRYTGTEEEVIVDSKEISSAAFFNSKVKRIVFSEKCTCFNKDIILDCNELTDIIFQAKTWCTFKTFTIRNCEKLQNVKWPRLIESKNISIYTNCPLLGDMIINRVLISSGCRRSICVIDSDVQVVNDYAFQNSSCLIVIIPKTVDEVGKYAFHGSSIKVVIFEGAYTKWIASHWSSEDTYLYIAQGGYAAQNSRFLLGNDSNCYLKNIYLLDGVIGRDINLERIEEIISQNMNQRSDVDILMKRDDYSQEIEISKNLVDRSNEYSNLFIHPSIEGTQLGDNYDSIKYEGNIEIYDTFGGNSENTGKYGYGLGNGDKLTF